MGQIAQEEPEEILKLTGVLMAGATQVFDHTTATDVSKRVSEIETLCFEKVYSEEENAERWEQVRQHGRRIEAKVKNIKYGLPPRQLAVFKLAIFIAQWDEDFSMDARLTPVEQHTFSTLCRAVVSNPFTLARIDAIVTEYNESQKFSKWHFPDRVYAIIRNDLEMQIISTIGLDIDPPAETDSQSAGNST
jgi:hypothetical protein